MRCTPEGLADRLRRQGPLPLYLVCGDEPLQCQEAVDSLRASLRERGAERVALAAEAGFDWGLFEASVKGLSLFSPLRYIEITLDGAAPGVEGARAIVSYAQRPPADTVVLIRSRRLEPKARQSAWFKAIDAVGAIIEVWPVPAEKLPHWLMRRAERCGLHLPSEAAVYLAERVENNLVAASHELEKLRLLASDLALPETLAILSDGSRYDVFMLADRVLAGQLYASLRALRGLRAEGVEAPLVLWALSRDLRALCRLASRRDRSQPLDAALAELAVWERRRGLFRAAVERHASGSLRAMLLEALAIDRMIKGLLPGDPWQSLERLCTALASPAQGD